MISNSSDTNSGRINSKYINNNINNDNNVAIHDRNIHRSTNSINDKNIDSGISKK